MHYKFWIASIGSRDKKETKVGCNYGILVWWWSTVYSGDCKNCTTEWEYKIGIGFLVVFLLSITLAVKFYYQSKEFEKSYQLVRSKNRVLSDFIDENYADELRHIAKKHDVIGVKVYDNLDMELPNIGLLQIQDVETGETKWIDTGDTLTQKTYRERAVFYDRNYEQSFVKAGADKLKIKTEQSYVHVLMNFFKKRA